MKDYNFKLSYHPNKAKVVADALNKKSLHISALMVREFDLIRKFRDLSLVCEVTLVSVKLEMLKLTNNFLNEIKEGQKLDVEFVHRQVLVNKGKELDFRVYENGILKFRDKVYVSELKKTILEENHRSSLSIHLGATKMYQDLKKIFWWSGMKKEIVKFVYACLTRQNSKIEHQKSYGLMKPLSIPE